METERRCPLGSILVAREQNSAPFELEAHLVLHSSRGVRAVSKLTGGAHFLLPSAGAGGATLAIRMYDADRIGRFEQEMTEGSTEFFPDGDEDFDDLVHFR
eukprot:CAMPEP_0113297334 /NCGR_PEP_ID=MMETSP0010_2-20120614/244_1 /TAXON_ID=216773 ORGANISM="Corethron hystrix, Strain 308" /NCGR_SAMPLE_ID=MMETSP0010_2 /ASSEMBLY_ACC=CAM_ASM_000155 /LENGTH=100 /DNA_ID=CAMNT_0000150215 /DNA_START=199 /DNA_END=498 /DNA_ORIENTATION=- /assembly_acc=CAM_ASM_000155